MENGAVAGLILAAGSARRFGADKRQAAGPDGRSLLEITLQTFTAALPRTWVVLQPGDAFGMALCERHGAIPVFNPDHESGMGSSLSAGIAAVGSQPATPARPLLEGVVVGLADMPALLPQTVGLLARRLAESGRPVLPMFGGRSGQPRGIPRLAFPALMKLEGDAGARHALDWSRAERVEVDDPGCLLDIDTPEALARWRAGEDAWKNA